MNIQSYREKWLLTLWYHPNIIPFLFLKALVYFWLGHLHWLLASFVTETPGRKFSVFNLFLLKDKLWWLNLNKSNILFGHFISNCYFVPIFILMLLVPIFVHISSMFFANNSTNRNWNPVKSHSMIKPKNIFESIFQNAYFKNYLLWQARSKSN